MPRTKKTIVILVSGKAGSGKSTVADMVQQKLEDIPSITVMRYGFADPLKYIAKAFMGWDGKKDEKGRKLLQEIGRIGREYEPAVWAKHFFNQLDKRAGMFPFNFAVIDDWRFPNELAYLLKNPLLSVVTIRVFGRTVDMPGNTASDISENSLPEVTSEVLTTVPLTEYSVYNFQIENTGQIEILGEKVDAVLAEIEKQYIVE